MCRRVPTGRAKLGKSDLERLWWLGDAIGRPRSEFKVRLKEKKTNEKVAPTLPTRKTASVVCRFLILPIVRCFFFRLRFSKDGPPSPSCLPWRPFDFF